MLIHFCSVGEVGKLLGAKWKEMDEDEKKVCIMCCFMLKYLTDCPTPQPYNEQAGKDRERVEREKAAYDTVSPIT
jgi:hypothetical protein